MRSELILGLSFVVIVLLLPGGLVEITTRVRRAIRPERRAA